MSGADTQYLFPSLDALEMVIWCGAGLLAFVVSAVVADLIILVSTRWRLVDLPNRRSAHALPTARGGGLAIVSTAILGMLAAAVRYPDHAGELIFGLLLPSLAIAIVGFIDDIRPLRPLLRLAIQIAAAVAVTAVLGPLTAVGLPGAEPFRLGLFAWPLTVVWLVGMINAFNFMDGSDGMLALAATVAGLFLALLAWMSGALSTTLVAGFVAAAAGGFLVFNWPPARIFMGDVGSGFLGAVFGALPLLLPADSRESLFVPVVLVLWPYIYDPLLSVLRRIWNGANPLQPHREFLFHRLIRSGVDHGRAALVYAFLSLCGGSVAFSMLDASLPVAIRTLLPLVAVGMAACLTWSTERLAARKQIDGPPAPQASLPVPRPR